MSCDDTDFAAALCELQALADQIHAHARDGHPITLPIKAVHRQLVDEMGGTPAWEAMKADLAIAKEKLKW